MPDIIRHGTIELADPSLWWVGKQLNCPHCKAVFRLTEADRPYVQAATERMGEQRTVAIKCPTALCPKHVAYSEPNEGYTARPAAAADRDLNDAIRRNGTPGVLPEPTATPAVESPVKGEEPPIKFAGPVEQSLSGTSSQA